MKKFFLINFIFLFLAFNTFAMGDNFFLPDGNELIYKSRNRDKGGQVLAKATMTITLNSGYKKTRELLISHKKFEHLGGEKKHLIIFTSPIDLKGVSFLDWNFEEEEFMFLFLSASREKHIKRINNFEKHKSFIGTEFSYSDLRAHHESDYKSITISLDFVNNFECWLVRSIPVKHSAYTKIETCLETRSLTPIRTKYYSKNKLIKTLNVIKLSKIEDIWTVTEIEMTNHKNGRSTLVKVDAISYDVHLPSELFELENLVDFEKNINLSLDLIH